MCLGTQIEVKFGSLGTSDKVLLIWKEISSENVTNKRFSEFPVNFTKWMVWGGISLTYVGAKIQVKTQQALQK